MVACRGPSLKIKDNAIFNYSKLIWSLRTWLLTLVIDISDSPVRVLAFISMRIYIWCSQSHTHWDIVVVFYWHTVEFTMLSNYFAHDLKLVIRITFDISLESFLYNNLILKIFNLNKYLEWVSLKYHKFISEVVWVLIYWYPNIHGMLL